MFHIDHVDIREKHPSSRRFITFKNIVYCALILSLLLSACHFPKFANPDHVSASQLQSELPGEQPTQIIQAPFATPSPARPVYKPGELVDYTAQTGDTLPALAARFNTTVAEIMEANPIIPQSATTMPPGMPMKIPIYYVPFWGSAYQIIPDSLFVNGPAQVNFNTAEFVSQHNGWLNNYEDYAGAATRSGAEIVDYVAQNYSVSPMLLLALLEYKSGALSQAEIPNEYRVYPLGYESVSRKGLYQQLIWTANTLNNGYYGWRGGDLLSIEFKDGRVEQFDPWQNAATVALHYYYNFFSSFDDYQRAISSEGLAATFHELFGDPWEQVQDHIPGSLQQPELTLPFLAGGAWALTGGPHTGWGTGAPFAALDFAPPSVSPGCVWSEHWATAMAPGVVARVDTGVVILDLDGDGDERTGWDILYLHVATDGRVPLGSQLNTGDHIGHPSCEGGTATGTHIHVVRKYNGEWILADSALAFNLEGWIAHNGSKAYLGSLTKLNKTIIARENPNAASFIEASPR
jgi:LasA protease